MRLHGRDTYSIAKYSDRSHFQRREKKNLEIQTEMSVFLSVLSPQWSWRSSIWNVYVAPPKSSRHQPPVFRTDMLLTIVKFIWAKFGVFKLHYLGQVKGHHLGQGDFQPIFIVVSGDVFFAGLSFRVFFCAQLLANSLKMVFFRKRVQKLVFPILSVLSLTLENYLSFGLLKHYKNWGFGQLLSFLVEREKNRPKRMITGISGFVFCCRKMAVSWRTSVLKKCFAETPNFIVFFGCTLFWPSCPKGKLWTPTKKKRLIIEKLFFVFLCFLLFFPLVFFCFFFGGFKGRVRWPEGPPHLALNPPCLFFFCLIFLGGGGSFLSLLLIEKKTVFPQKKGIFLFLLECLPLFLLSSLFLASHFFNFCFSVSLLFFSFFLPSCHYFLLSFGSSLFLSRSFLFFLHCFCFTKGTTCKYSITKFFSSILSFSSLFWVFLSWFLFQIPLSYLCFS